jgi:hypothetical protein
MLSTFSWRRKPALIQKPTHQQKMDACGQSVFGKFVVMRDACLSVAPVIAALVEVMIAWRNRQVHSLADNQVSLPSWETLRANANWVKDEFRGMEIDRLFADFRRSPAEFQGNCFIHQSNAGSCSDNGCAFAETFGAAKLSKAAHSRIFIEG